MAEVVLGGHESGRSTQFSFLQDLWFNNNARAFSSSVGGIPEFRHLTVGTTPRFAAYPTKSAES